MFKHLLVPIDGSELSTAAAKAACAFALETGARITFYHAMPGLIPAYVTGEMIPNDPAVDAMFLASRDQLAQALVQAVENIAAAVGVASDTVREECDSPHEGIIDAATARGCDLIFMASHGRRGMSALLLGSETQKVLTHCRIPVLVYR